MIQISFVGKLISVKKLAPEYFEVLGKDSVTGYQVYAKVKTGNYLPRPGDPVIISGVVFETSHKMLVLKHATLFSLLSEIRERNPYMPKIQKRAVAWRVRKKGEKFDIMEEEVQTLTPPEMLDFIDNELIRRATTAEFAEKEGEEEENDDVDEESDQAAESDGV